MSNGLDAVTLDIDLGNSALKYRLADYSGRLPHLADGAIDIDGLHRALVGSNARSATGSLQRVRVCSVLSSDLNTEFAEQIMERWGVTAEFARSLPAVGGVTNGYREPSSLGVDRWMVVLAAYHRCSGAALVIDLGTAITLDFLRADGQHLGGYIVPGTHLSQRVLLTDTASIAVSADSSAETTERLLQPGSSTQEAVSRGALLMVRNLIELEAERLRASSRQSLAVLLCGGGAQEISPLLQCAHEILPDLVLEGLDLALP